MYRLQVGWVCSPQLIYLYFRLFQNASISGIAVNEFDNASILLVCCGHRCGVRYELQEAGGARGALYHKLILKRVPGMELPKIASEGEARWLSIAAFIAELSTADDPSAILFDDPISSLDHKWRTAVGERLVEEAKTRQVIVFTHDIVFLLVLHKYADDESVELQDQHLRREAWGRRLRRAATLGCNKGQFVNRNPEKRLAASAGAFQQRRTACI